MNRSYFSTSDGPPTGLRIYLDVDWTLNSQEKVSGVKNSDVENSVEFAGPWPIATYESDVLRRDVAECCRIGARGVDVETLVSLHARLRKHLFCQYEVVLSTSWAKNRTLLTNYLIPLIELNLRPHFIGSRKPAIYHPVVCVTPTFVFSATSTEFSNRVRLIYNDLASNPSHFPCLVVDDLFERFVRLFDARKDSMDGLDVPAEDEFWLRQLCVDTRHSPFGVWVLVRPVGECGYENAAVRNLREVVGEWRNQA